MSAKTDAERADRSQQVLNVAHGYLFDMQQMGYITVNDFQKARKALALEIVREFAAVRAEERERCAKIAENRSALTGDYIAAAIRRGE